MDESRAVRFWTTLGALICSVALSPFAAGAVGRTPGSFNVTSNGAATYTVPLWVPPGPNGMQPSLALVYSSGASTGYLGVGWALSGLSDISRCDQTVAQDGAAVAVSLTSADRFCLDGKRLRLTSSENLTTYGSDGSTYQTELADFSNVTAHGVTGVGPTYFTVQGKNGWTYQYGNGGNSQVLANGGTSAVAWWLSQVTDRDGNAMTVTYQAANVNSNLQGTTVPASISWTPGAHGSNSYNYTVSFDYQILTAPLTAGYVAGTARQNFYLLSDITIKSAGAPIKSYVFGYTPGATTGRETLTTLSECTDTTLSNCLLPTQFTYQPGQQGLAPNPTSISGLQSESGGKGATAFDFNGDGIDDIAVYDAGQWHVSLGSPTGYGTPIATTITSSLAKIGSVDGTGKDGFLVPQSGFWWYYRLSGLTFSGVNTNIAVDSNNASGTMTLADVDGDGRPDIVYGGSDGFIDVLLNTSTAGVVSFAAKPIQTLAYGNLGITSIAGEPGGVHRRFDFYGDGQSDLLAYKLSASGHATIVTVYALHFTGSTFTMASLGSNLSNQSVVDIGDYNDDGCLDVLWSNALKLAACNGTVPTSLTFGSDVAVAGLHWDDSGRQAVVVNHGGVLGIYKSTGTGLGALIPTTIPYVATNSYLAIPNAVGDGEDALGVFNGSTTEATAQYYLHNSGPVADLLSNVRDGYGNSASPTYVSMGLSASTYTELGNCTYPYQNYQGPDPVVAHAVYSDPGSLTHGTYSITYQYSGDCLNLQGRGMTGFQTFKSTDSRNNVTYNGYFEFQFPLTGIQYEFSLVQPNGSTIKQSTDTLAAVALDSNAGATNQRYTIYPTATTAYEWGVDATSGQLLKTAQSNYTFDNFGNLENATTVLTDDDTSTPSLYMHTWTTSVTNTFDVDGVNQSEDLGAWCLTFVDKTVVAYTASDGSLPVTRTTSYIPDTTAECRISQAITEPSNSLYQVTEVFGYDAFGNVHTDTVTGIGMGASSPATRTTTIDWTTAGATTGQFPMDVTDPSGAFTQYNYDFNFGGLTSRTDPNSTSTNPIVTTWQYGDGFGRPTKQTFADGTYTVYQYYDCTVLGTCLIGPHSLSLEHMEYNVDGTFLSDGIDFFDQIDRPLVSTTPVLADGAYARNEVRYDSLGRIVQSASPCNYISGAVVCPNFTTVTYDLLNRPTAIQQSFSESNGGAAKTTAQYLGDRTVGTDPLGNATTVVTDVNGWLRETTSPPPATGQPSYSVTVGYDAAGSANLMTDSLGNTLFSAVWQYGIQPFKVSSTDMDSGAWGYTYDALGELTSWADAKGQPFSMTYDALSRPVQRFEPDTFTQWTWGSSAASHNIGKLQSACVSQGQTTNPTACTAPTPQYSDTRTYDTLGRLYQRILAGTAYNASYTYTRLYNSNTGLLDTLTYPTSTSGYALQVKYGYTSGIASSITNVSDSPNVTLWAANASNPAGQITQQTLGNGVVINRTFDAVTGWMSGIQAGVGGGTTLQNETYLYDFVGNLTQRQDNNRGLTESYCYDNLYRLDHSTMTGLCSSPPNLQLHYDGMGNITSRSDVNAGATWTYDAARKHAVTSTGSGGSTYSYDANGNRSLSGAFYSFNYPEEVGYPGSLATFLYDQDRQRFQQEFEWFPAEGTTAAILESTSVIGGLLESTEISDFSFAGTTSDQTDWRHYIYAGGQPVAIVSRLSTGVNTTRYILSDRQQSVSTIADSSGNVYVNESFAPFGQGRDPTTWSGPLTAADTSAVANSTRMGYTFETGFGTQWTQTDPGFIHLNGRALDAGTGRFLSPDPYIPDQFNTQSYNRYSYVNNNPLTYEDHTGFDEDGDSSGDGDNDDDPPGDPPDDPPPGSPPGDDTPSLGLAQDGTFQPNVTITCRDWTPTGSVPCKSSDSSGPSNPAPGPSPAPPSPPGPTPPPNPDAAPPPPPSVPGDAQLAGLAPSTGVGGTRLLSTPLIATAPALSMSASNANALALSRAAATLARTTRMLGMEEAAGATTGPGEIPNQVIVAGTAAVGAGIACYQGCSALGSMLNSKLNQLRMQIAQPLVHGNSLSSRRMTWVYQLVSNRSQGVLKYGITSMGSPETRYPSFFYAIGNFRMELLKQYPTRAQARADEFGRCVNYTAVHGSLPPLSIIC